MRTKQKEQFADIYYSQVMQKGNLVLLMTTPQNKLSTLQVIKNDATIKSSLPNIIAFKVSPDQNSILFVQQKEHTYTLNSVDLTGSIPKVKEVNRSKNPFTNLVWQSNSSSFAYLEEVDKLKDLRIHHFNLKSHQSKVLNYYEQNCFASYSFQAYTDINMSISVDGTSVFFFIKSTEFDVKKSEDSKVVEVWNAADKQVSPYIKQYGRDGIRKLGVWYLSSNTTKVIGSEHENLYSLNGSQDYVITKKNWGYLPTTKQIPDTDFILHSLDTGESSVLLEKIDVANQNLLFSPDGSCLLYFKEKELWKYDFKIKSHTLLKCINSSFFEMNNDKTHLAPYGIAGWSPDGRFVFIYDQFDLWKVSLKNDTAHRMTNGHETRKSYRIMTNNENNRDNRSWFTPKITIVDFKKDILLSSTNEKEHCSGISILYPNGNLKKIVFEGKSHDMALYDSAIHSVFYQREDYNVPPQLMLSDTQTGKSTTIFQSNPHHFDYKWGFSEVVRYKNKAGDSLQGALYYPANFEKGKEYPLVVQIYERLSNNVHKYINPSLYNTVGFNTTNLTSQGYFVLQPDITYETGNPGFSALDCVEAAVKSTLQKGTVDAKRIGLIGQSFGGYETYFIISQSQLFATGIAGAGVSDLTSFYLTLGKDTALPDLWRFEHQQFRMGKSFFENKEMYESNSPMTYAASISVPLLTWTGTKDETVTPEQTMRWYIAMHRLGKKHIMLQYPEQGHVIFNPIQQKDLTLKVEEWFDYYLKNGNKKRWMFPN